MVLLEDLWAIKANSFLIEKISLDTTSNNVQHNVVVKKTKTYLRNKYTDYVSVHNDVYISKMNSYKYKL